ncbi:hypothetical protein EUTSA_v10011135mg [Eutrema salsugineum]|uniref:Peptidase S8/S53 domain-containing protein n=1 Tax=Eutrema salsugineum TaxID=72664 RepID=V4LST6_EUTSA|nr:hypothetical protein EUTSA_v10011135mg [Eutrema salsugineum]
MSSDVLSAMDKAIEDGVNVLSFSLGLGTLEYDQDAVAIGALAAVKKGIFVSASAGNDGLSESTLMNVAPWITTIGAGTVDRDFPAIAILGNGKAFGGVSTLFKSSFDNFTEKIVLIDMGSGTDEFKTPTNRPLGIIYANTAPNGRELVAPHKLIPSLTVGKISGDEIRDYILKDAKPTAMIKFKGTVLHVKPAPVVAGFSSRGPNSVTPEILKPDLIAPGVNILAAWTRATGLHQSDPDLKQVVDFSIQSGTSMSCPHLSGIAALLKAAAIRSALMTTANRNGNDGKPILDSTDHTPSTPFLHGAGHVSPISALNPGLIYDLTAEDYLDFLCASNYTSSQIRTVARRDFTCDPKKRYRIADFNYPSFAVIIDHSRGEGGAYKYTRVVTSVGGGGTYRVKVVSETRVVNISVEPAVIEFKEVNQRKSYTH